MGKNVISHKNLSPIKLKLTVSGFTGEQSLLNGDYDIEEYNQGYIAAVVDEGNQLRTYKTLTLIIEDGVLEYLIEGSIIEYHTKLNISKVKLASCNGEETTDKTDAFSQRVVQFTDINSGNIITITLPELIADEETIDIEYTLNEKIEDKTVNFYIDKTLIQGDKLEIDYNDLPENIEIVTNPTKVQGFENIVDSFIISGEVINNEVTSSLISVQYLQYPPTLAKKVTVNWKAKSPTLKVSGFDGDCSCLNGTYNITTINENVIVGSADHGKSGHKSIDISRYSSEGDGVVNIYFEAIAGPEDPDGQYCQVAIDDPDNPVKVNNHLTDVNSINFSWNNMNINIEINN